MTEPRNNDERHMKQFKNPNTGKLEWRYGPHPDSPQGLNVAYKKIPEQARARLRKNVEQWTDKSEEAKPKRQPGEGASTFELRRQKDLRDRETVIRQRTVAAYKESLKPTPGQKFIGLMNEGAKLNIEKRRTEAEAQAKIDKAKKEAQERNIAAAKQEWRGGL